MLTRTEKDKNKPKNHGPLFETEKETLAQLLVRLGVTKVKSYPCTPEHKPQDKPKEQPATLRL